MTTSRLPALEAAATGLCHTPHGVRAALGVVAVLVGSACVRQPFLSLRVVAVVAAVAVADLVIGAVTAAAGGPAGSRRRPPFGVAAAVPLAAAVAAVLAAAPVLDVLAVVLPVGLVAAGAATLGRLVFRRRIEGRDGVGAVLAGAAELGAGALGLLWPDLAEYVLACVLGIATALAGLWLIVTRRPAAPDRVARRRWPARVGSGVVLVVTVFLLAETVDVGPAAPGFVLTPPATVPARPGALVATESITDGLPAGVRGWRILYTTERADGSPTVASGLVAVTGDRRVAHPVVAWAHGTTGYSGACGPSSLTDPLGDAGGGSGAVVTAAVEAGAALVATDYPGLGTPGPQPYLIGRGEAHAVLDAVRAARGLPDLVLLDQVVIWGHSQGGHAALWAGELAPAYAPDLAVVGVAALAPPTDLLANAAQLDIVPGATIFLAYLLSAYADTYPDVGLDGLLEPGGTVVVRSVAGRCVNEPAGEVSQASSQLLGPLLAGPVDGSPFATRLRENDPVAPIRVPVLIAQGSDDDLVPQAGQDRFVQQLCRTGTMIDYRVYPGRDHLGLILAGSPLLPALVDWSRDRVTGVPAGSTC